MARKEADYTVSMDGRDKGKTFRLTEMSAIDAQDFADRLFFAAMNTGIDIPDGLEKLGMEGLWVVGIQMAYRVPYEFAKPLLDKLQACVKILAGGVVRALVVDDIEEVSTVFALRKEVLRLHFGFFATGGGLTSDITPEA